MQLTFVSAEIASILMDAEGFGKMKQSSVPRDRHNSPVIMRSNVLFTTHLQLIFSPHTCPPHCQGWESFTRMHEPITILASAGSCCMLTFSAVLYKHLHKQVCIHFMKTNWITLDVIVSLLHPDSPSGTFFDFCKQCAVALADCHTVQDVKEWQNK